MCALGKPDWIGVASSSRSSGEAASRQLSGPGSEAEADLAPPQPSTAGSGAAAAARLDASLALRSSHSQQDSGGQNQRHQITESLVCEKKEKETFKSGKSLVRASATAFPGRTGLRAGFGGAKFG